MTPRHCGIRVLCTWAIALAGCEVIPALQFVGPDSSIGTGATDATGETQVTDAADEMQSMNAADAGDDSSDASTETSCMGPLPLGVNSPTCCGSLWCIGTCDAAACASCETLRTCLGWCCDRAGVQTCKSGNSRCF